MSSTSPLRSIGLYGWDAIELTVLSALVARIPLLFVGGHGAAKTDGAEGIARTILGDRLRWASYPCHMVQTDDIVGMIRPDSLNDEMYSYVGSAISVWNINAVVLDEITRAHPASASKFLEMIRTKKVYGMPTPLEYVFATANPPTREYQVNRLDAANISRFAVVNPPSFSDLSDDDAEKVLHGNVIGGTWDWWPLEAPSNTKLALKLRKLLASKGVMLSGRSAKHLQKMLGAAFLVPVERTSDALTTLVLSCVPEASVVCTTYKDTQDAAVALTSFFDQYLMTSLPPTTDWPAYMAALTSMVSACSSTDDAQKVVDQIPQLRIQMHQHREDVLKFMADAMPVLARHLDIQAYTVPEWLGKVFQ